MLLQGCYGHHNGNVYLSKLTFKEIYHEQQFVIF
jgi:hypothetical protein